MKYNEVQYILRNPQLGRIVLNYEPINWDDSKRENIRSQDNWGVFTKLSEENEFVKDGYNFIKNIKETQGTEATCTINRQIRPYYDGNWQTDYFGYLDFKTYSESNERLKIKIKTGGLQSLIENQWDEEFELERETDINGNDIEPIGEPGDDNPVNYKAMNWSGRRILTRSKLSDDENYIINFEPSFVQEAHKVLPLQIDYTKFDRAYAQNFPQTKDGNDNFELGMFFYRAKNTTDVEINIDCNMKVDFYNDTSQDTPELSFFTISLYKMKINNDDVSNISFVETIDVFFAPNPAYNGGLTPDDDLIQGNTFNYQYQGVVSLESDEVLSLTGTCFFAELNFTEVDNKVLINENTYFDPTFHLKALKPIDYFRRLTEIITGNIQNFKSDWFEDENNDEVMANGIMMTGMHLRNNPDAVHKASLKKVFSLSAFKKLGWGIETINGREVLRVEPIEYFLDKTNKIDIGKVDELTQKVEPKYLYKSLGFGNPDAGQYEQSIGNTEYNTFNTYFTPLKTAENKYNAETEIRHDLVAAEIERRKQWNETVDEDEEFDDDIFIFDVKKENYNGNLNTDYIYQPRSWEDDFAQEPEQIYDPESAGNLRLTPFRCLIRHSNFFTSGMEYYQNQKVGYKSTQGQADVIIDGLNEKGEKTINELANPFFTAEMYEFEKPLTFGIKNILNSKTNNKSNLYFIVKFVYRNEVKEGFLINVTENNNSKWKLLKIR